MNISITKPQPDRADWTLEINGCRHFMTGAALAALHGVLIDHFIAEDKAKCAAQAALAEQNSGVMGEAVCKCGITLYPVCDSYVQCPCGCDQCINSKCLHDKACHQPQAQRREA